MRFYVTKESIDRIKSSFLNARSFFIIDTQEITESFADVTNEKYFNFLVNEEIKNIISNIMQKQKYNIIIYINEHITASTIENLKYTIKEIHNIDGFIFIDDENANKDLYPLFDEIVFFPPVQRLKIIECECIKNPLYYWLNNCKIPDKLKEH